MDLQVSKLLRKFASLEYINKIKQFLNYVQ